MLKIGGIGMSERGPILLDSDPQYVEFGPNLGIQPLKGPNFRPIRAAIHHGDRVYMTLRPIGRQRLSHLVTQQQSLAEESEGIQDDANEHAKVERCKHLSSSASEKCRSGHLLRAHSL